MIKIEQAHQLLAKSVARFENEKLGHSSVVAGYVEAVRRSMTVGQFDAVQGQLKRRMVFG